VRCAAGRELEVEQHHIWALLVHQCESLLPRGGFAHDAEIRFALEHRAQPFSRHRMIIDQHHAHGGTASIGLKR